MARFVLEDRCEITRDYVNVPDGSARIEGLKGLSGKVGGVTAAVSGRKLYRLVAVSFGLLCIVQAALNISLRFALYSSDRKTPDIDAGCKNLTEDRDELKRKLIDFDHYLQQGWVYFHSSFYYISSTKKTWTDSRDDCLKRGADLIIINSKEEQNFTREFHKVVWIGLRDRENKGTWEWVDSTPLTDSYWHPGEPNNYEGRQEDCVDLMFHNNENSWNDAQCDSKNFWICEKTMSF